MTQSENEFPGTSSFDLRGKQSVRATFKLSQKAIDAIGLVAIHMGIKQKTLFDHIIEDVEALEGIARTIRIRQFKKIPRVQKTYVLSRKTIETLESTSMAHDTPRDALVEYSIQKLEAVIESEKIRHEERKRLLKEVHAHFETGMALLAKAHKNLGRNDPFCNKMETILSTYKKNKADMDRFIEKSKVLEAY